jgi:DNA-binding transcriptional MerR regulator
MEGFTAEQASRLTSCTPHQLRYWDKVALVQPELQQTRGRPGVRRLYSFRDLVALRMIKSLLDGGMSLQKVRRAYAYLRKKAALDEELSGARLVTDSTSVYAIDDEEVVADLLQEGQLAFSLVLDHFAGSVNGKVASHIYNRGDFVQALRRIEQDLESRLAPADKRAAARA